MTIRRIHVFGASGSGTTTLAKHLEGVLGFPHLDVDDFYWEPTHPPFTRPRERTARTNLLRQALEANETWALSGSLCGWGDFTTPSFDLAVFLWVRTPLRIQRLKQRERHRYGPQIENPADRQHESNQRFLSWAADYDGGGLEMRSRILHEQWMRSLTCSLLRIEGDHSGEERLRPVLAHIADKGAGDGR